MIFFNFNTFRHLKGLILLFFGALLFLAEVAPVQAKKVIWSGSWTQEGWLYGKGGEFGNVHNYKHFIEINFTFEQDIDAYGKNRWTSRKVSWRLKGESKVKNDSIKCQDSDSESQDSGGGTDSNLQTVDLGPLEGNLSPATITPEQQKRFKGKCESNIHGITAMGYMIEPPDTAPVGLAFAGIGDRKKLGENCTYSWEHKGRPNDIGSNGANTLTRYTISLSEEIDAVMDVKIDDRSPYYQFIPQPGPPGKVWFVVNSNVPAFFKFTLEGVSNFPGYATNADVDDAFFFRYSLDHLKGQYKNDSPDLIFDAEDFKNKKEDWKKPSWDTAKTKRPMKLVGVSVSAMDFGAYGHLRAEARSQCGNWQPVKIRVGGQESDVVKIPMDEDDNLIADRLDKEMGYKGDPGRDDDSDPKGDGTSGDGFTAFEEYRGFIVSDGHCSDSKQDYHIRTDPRKKDLFIHPEDAFMAEIAALFGKNAGLTVHLICDRHYVDNKTRIMNFTLQKDGPKVWEGKIISQSEPQHGLYISVSGSDQEGFSLGPPKFVGPINAVGEDYFHGSTHGVSRVKAINLGLHLLGHAVGMRHHGEGNNKFGLFSNGDWVVLVDASPCPQGKGVGEGTVNGKPVCVIVGGIAVQHGELSGNQECPMRPYERPYWYVPPSSSPDLVGRGDLQFGNSTDPDFPTDRHILPDNPLYRMRVRRYQADKDPPGVGKFCSSTKGTGINALPGDLNHGGDSRRACMDQIRVNDVGAKPPSPNP